MKFFADKLALMNWFSIHCYFLLLISRFHEKSYIHTYLYILKLNTKEEEIDMKYTILTAKQLPFYPLSQIIFLKPMWAWFIHKIRLYNITSYTDDAKNSMRQSPTLTDSDFLYFLIWCFLYQSKTIFHKKSWLLKVFPKF